MTTYVALLRAVNVGGTGKLPMADLKRMAEEIGLARVRTYIASGNLVFASAASEAEIKAALERRLAEHVGKSVGVLVRSAAEMAQVLARNPFPDRPANRTLVLFVDEPLPSDPLDGVTGRQDEEVRLGRREIYVSHGPDMGNSRLRIPAAKTGTARNINTVAKLATMAAEP